MGHNYIWPEQEKLARLSFYNLNHLLLAKAAFHFYVKNKMKKMLQVNNLISCTYLVKIDDMICSGVKYEFTSMPNSFGNHVSGALRLWDLTKEMTHNNPAMILDTNP